MQHVVHSVPATWRGGTIPAIAARLELRERIVRLYHQLTDGAVLVGVRTKLGARWVAIIHKARSLTQSPSHLERAGETIIALHLAGAKPHELRQVSVAFDAIVDELVAPAGPVRESDVRHALEISIMMEAKENEAEALLLCRPDRELAPGDVARLIEAKESEIAADRDAVVQLRRLLLQRAASQGMTVIRGGRS